MPSQPPNTTPAAWRDWQSRTANTVLMYCYTAAFAASAVISGQAVARRRPRTWWKGTIDPDTAERLSYANAAMDGVSLLYIAFFLTLHHCGREMAVWAQIGGLLFIVAWNVAFGAALQASERLHEWLWASGILDYVKAAIAVVLIAFLTTHTLVMHGAAGFKDSFAPLADGVTAQRRHRLKTADKATKRDRDARIALVVLVSVLDAFVLAAVIMSCIETLDIWESYARGLNPGHIASIPFLCIYFIWLSIYLFVRASHPDSRFVTARNDVACFSAWGTLLLILGSAALAVYVAGKSSQGGFTAIACLSAGGCSLILALFEGIYTRLHGGEGRWHRRFATAKRETEFESAQDVELAQQKSSRPSTEVDKDEQDEHQAPTLGYNVPC